MRPSDVNKAVEQLEQLRSSAAEYEATKWLYAAREEHLMYAPFADLSAQLASVS